MAPVKITQDNVRDVKDRLDLVDIASEWIDLKKMGDNYKGLCPFHREKTPSFVINQSKQIYHCFGCGAGGDLISFVQNVENLPFAETIIKLAALAGIELKEEGSAVSRRIADKKERLAELNLMAKDFFYKTLNSGTGNKGSEYAAKRGLSAETMEAFSIGYAPDAWDELTTLFTKKGKSLAEAVSLGLIKEKNGKYYDVFRSRLMFPILDHRGQILAFGGRKLDVNTDETPKYINSRESELYVKGDTLYGIYQNNRNIREEGYAIVVEGYMDLVSLYRYGIKNVVATLGTAFTEKQAKLLKRYTDRVVMFYDGDNAGINAAKKSLPMLLQNNFRVDALILENDMDPDDAVKNYGRDLIVSRLKDAKPLLARVITDSFSGDFAIGKVSESTSRVLDYIALIPDHVTQALWIKELSIRSGLNIRELNRMLREHGKDIAADRGRKQPVKMSQRTNAISRPKNVPNLYKHLVRILIKNIEYCACIFEEEWDMYIPNDLRNMLYRIRDIKSDRGVFADSDWMTIAREEGFQWIESEFSRESLKRDGDEGPDIESNFRGCMLWFKENYLKNKRQEYFTRIKEGEKTDKTLREYEAIVQEINQLKR
ncbi:MAG: DNA primase [Oligoflexia bacterium]|nr:DNA primase [Oligoflexia bacterium]